MTNDAGIGVGAQLVERMRPFTSTIFAEITAEAVRNDAVNLGQGFPDTDGPASMLEIARQAITDGVNQYPPGPGVPDLRAAIAEHQQRFHGLTLDPDSEVLVTVGATEAIAASILALCEPGDEVVTFEPYYDSYAAAIAMAGATRRTAVLRAPEFAVDPDELRSVFSSATRAVLLNTPHNPTGKVFTRAELTLIAELAHEHDAVVITDEVYEHLVYDATTPHAPIAGLPGMHERVLTISSAAKTFSVTGWKIGWVHGPAQLIAAVRAVKQYLTFVGGAPFQPAVAHALRLPQAFFADLARDLADKRALLIDALTETGLAVHPQPGSYFLLADAAPLGSTDAARLCRAMPEAIGVAAVPVSVFHDDNAAAPTMLRLAFCKRHEVLAEGARRLHRLPEVVEKLEGVR
ncbi:MAG TPA: pyridoxal phosphate-dependent aminotransferase [Jiangellaceae bacterium]|nr:pyridoxal phosphate-dependent aminotransferase [Jiangellaceae bacterium]